MTQMTDKRKLMHYSKYGAAKPVYKGHKFDSGLEMLRFRYLEAAEKAGEISDLKTQVSFTLVPALKVRDRKERAILYKADFVYKKKDGTKVVEDVKGYRTAEYVIKRKLMLYVHDIAIREITSAAEKI